MGFVSPWFLTTFIFLAGLVAIYMFKKQYEDKQIASDLFWREAMNEWQATKWWHKLQKHLLFYLQFLIILLLIFALIRPFSEVQQEVEGEHIIILLDTSASMSAKSNEEQSRFEHAKAEIEILLDKVQNNQQVSFLLVGQTSELAVTKTTNSNEIKEVLQSSELSFEEANFPYALSLVDALSVEQNLSVHIYSDQLKEEELAIEGDYPLYVHNIGKENSNNAGIGAFVMLESEQKGFLQLYNESAAEKVVEYQVKVDGEWLLTETATLAGAQSTFIEIESIPAGFTYEAVIQNEDDYELDNRIVTFSQIVEQPTVYAVGHLSPFLLQLLPQISEQIVLADSYESIHEFEPNSVIVTDSNEGEWPGKPTLFIAVNEGGPLRFSDKRELTVRPTQQTGEALLNYLDFSSVFVSLAREREEELLTEALVQSDSVALIERGVLDNEPFLSINFDLHDSDWPLKPDFPIFMYQAIDYLAGDTTLLGYFSPSERREIHFPNIGIYQLIDENGRILNEWSSEEPFIQAPKKPGLYQLKHQDGEVEQQLFVQLPERDNQITVEPSFEIGQSQGSSGAHQLNLKEFGHWLLLIALGLLLVEWEVYRRELRV
ncbi:BatA domain-containing protein [Alkalihalobacillus sp. 1P02AB]|uniref:BatA domain-containing protein n=1 Tax=Alkalihalobacillus sp. 1P02AB TaxID=3132260 RepID=UPI0039A5B1F3